MGSAVGPVSQNPPASTLVVNPRGSSSSARGLPRVSARIRSRTRPRAGGAKSGAALGPPKQAQLPAGPCLHARAARGSATDFGGRAACVVRANAAPGCDRPSCDGHPRVGGDRLVFRAGDALPRRAGGGALGPVSLPLGCDDADELDAIAPWKAPGRRRHGLLRLRRSDELRTGMVQGKGGPRAPSRSGWLRG
jgi:hypothetical protein